MKLSDEGALDIYIEGLGPIRSRIRSGLQQKTAVLADELEASLSRWLEDKGFEDAWKLAPILAEAGTSMPQLEEFLMSVSSGLYPLALQDLFATVSRDAAIASVVQASGRIFRIVTAVKDYSYMDRQALQEIEGISRSGV